MSLRNEQPGLLQPNAAEVGAVFSKSDLSDASSRGGQVSGMICHGIGLAIFCLGGSPILMGMLHRTDSGDDIATVLGTIAASMGSLFVFLVCGGVASVFNLIGRRLYGRRLIVSLPQLRDPRIRAMMLWGDWLGVIALFGMLAGGSVFLLVLFSSTP